MWNPNSMGVCSGVVNTARFSRVQFADHKVKWHRWHRYNKNQLEIITLWQIAEIKPTNHCKKTSHV